MNTTKIVFVLAFFLFAFCLEHSQAQQSVNISDLELSKLFQSYGKAIKDKAVTGEPLCIAGQFYDRGIGVQSTSKLKVQLQGHASSFSCLVGINDATLNYKDASIVQIPMTDGTMVFYSERDDKKQFIGIGEGDGSLKEGRATFKILADGKKLYSSGIMQRGEKAKEILLDVKGVKILELIVTDGEDGLSGDHADWINPIIFYNKVSPKVVAADFKGEAVEMNSTIKSHLKKKIDAFDEGSLTINRPKYDWLIDNTQAVAKIHKTANGKSLILSNGLVSRIFRIFPNLATIDIQNQMTGTGLLRAVCPEGELVLDGQKYLLGGLNGQFEYGYTEYQWIDKLVPFANSFKVVDFDVTPLTPRINWANKRWALAKKGIATGKVLTFTLRGPKELKDVKVKIHYALYDGMPCICKWFEIENDSPLAINVDSFKLETLAMVAPESPVELKNADLFLKPNVHIESDWAFGGMIEKAADATENWEVDSRFTSQCNYPLLTPCLLEVKLPMGPDVKINKGDTFTSFHNWMMPFDSENRERKGLFVKRMYLKIAPWTTENPIFLHCTSSNPKVVKKAIDQCAETGYEMVILSFGSGVNMEDESSKNYEKFKSLSDYAHSKGIELGGYSLLSSRWISDDVDVINPKTGKRGGMKHGSSPCLSSQWGHDYFRKVKAFYEKTGMNVFENDGSYPGNPCASTKHKFHKGLKDSQWKQRKEIAKLYEWMCAQGIYMNIPDYGYMLSGGSKTGIGYREVNWSLPRDRQLILGRQALYDGLWNRPSGMCWTFVPLTQYHGGGKAATIEPLNEHLHTYVGHMMQNYGAGVQACYRGPRLYDTQETKEAVIKAITWYKKYRDILNSDVLHLRRADGKSWDGFMHVNPNLKEKGLVMLFNPTNKDIIKTIQLPLYYTSLDKIASIREQEGVTERFTLNRDYSVDYKVKIPANGYTWLVIE